MGAPNGEMDTWADVIVTHKFRYIQVSAYYDQLTDVPSSLLSQLPSNSFTSWIAAKQPNIWDDNLAADQVGVAAVAIPGFVSQVAHVSQQGVTAANYPALAVDAAGPDLLVTSSVGSLATARFWQILGDPATYRLGNVLDASTTASDGSATGGNSTQPSSGGTTAASGGRSAGGADAGGNGTGGASGRGGASGSGGENSGGQATGGSTGTSV
jgi:hypothetical protein